MQFVLIAEISQYYRLLNSGISKSFYRSRNKLSRLSVKLEQCLNYWLIQATNSVI